MLTLRLALGMTLLCLASSFVTQPGLQAGLQHRPHVSPLVPPRVRTRQDSALAMVLKTEQKTENEVQDETSSARQGSLLSVQDMMSSSKEEIYSYVKSYGPAGIASIIIVGGVFWALYIPVIIFSYHQATGEWISPQLILFPVGATKVAVTALGFWSLARVLFPLRMAAAVAITPVVKAQLFDRFSSKDKEDGSE